MVSTRAGSSKDGTITAFFDIGTNAIRMLLARINRNHTYTILSKQRRIFIHPWLIEYHDTATRAAYKKIHTGGPEECGCEHCHNFALARDRIYPPEAENLFAMVGIDFKKETEVVHLRMIKPGLHQYTGSFHFVGTVENARDIRCDSTSYMAVNSNFSWQFKNSQEPVHGAFHNQPLVHVEFIAKVPWLAASSEPEQGATDIGHSCDVSDYRITL